MSKSTRPCIFCARRGLSKEHVWSRWTHQLVPPRPGGKHIKGYNQTSPSDPRVLATRERKNFQGEVNTIKLRVVCKTHCNNGWMSRLDTAVKPTLSPLILDQAITLDEDRQLTLARWIATKAMVAEHSRLSDVVSLQEDRTQLMLNAIVPIHWKIWIGRQTGLLWRSGYMRHACTLGYLDEHGNAQPPDKHTSKNTQSITLGIGHLIIHLISTRVPDLHFRFQTPTGHKLSLIHPSQEPIKWPPTDILNGAEIDQIAVSFDCYNSQLKWRALPVQ